MLMLWTGDAEFVAELAPVAEGVVRWFTPYLGEGGLLHDISGWSLVDWSTVHTEGCSASLNALWARALGDVAAIATWLGNVGVANWAQRQRQMIRLGFEAFWDADRELYREQLVGAAERVVTQHANATAIVAGLVPSDRHASICAQMMSRSRLVRHSAVMDGASDGEIDGRKLFVPYAPPAWDVERQILEAQPFFRYIVHDALVAAGEAHRIVDACLDWWPWVAAGESTWPETWSGGTHCHGWSSTPSRDLPTAVLGLRPALPGCVEMVWDPALGPLDWIEGSVPTPLGLVFGRVERQGSSLVSSIESPVPVQVRQNGVFVRALTAGNHVFKF